MSEQASREQTTSATQQAHHLARPRLLLHGVWITIIRIAIIGGFFLLWEIASGRWIEPFLGQAVPSASSGC